MIDHEHEAEVRRWFRYASQDLSAAEAALVSTGFAPRHVCGLAQQAAEKAIKALLVRHQIELPYRHDLEFLVALLPAGADVRLRDTDLSRLSEWAVESRYPGHWTEASRDDAGFAVEQANIVLNAARIELGSIVRNL